MIVSSAVTPVLPALFVPRRRLANGHVMTIFAWARTRDFPELPAREARLIRVADDSEVLAHCYWQPTRTGRPTLLALHGLEGSSDAHYMRGLASKAWRRGWNAVLLNQRNCGGTEHLTPGLYHSGLTHDPRTVMRTLAKDDGVGPFGVVGYSLGGNLALKLAGELVDHPDTPLIGAVGISPTMELETCVHAIERRRNYPYQWNFVRNIKSRMRRKAAAWPNRFDLGPLDRIWTIRSFDDRYTAPLNGFGDAKTYYFKASARRVVERTTIPTLILAAADDPFVPPAQFHDPAFDGHPHLQVRVQAHGGHCGFVGEPSADDDGYWAETSALNFLASLRGSSGLGA
jgi:predicted alpha/beta-fold hydrolase